MYEYKATVGRVIDGDTIIVDIDLGFHLTQHGMAIRLAGLDTPEIRGPERVHGLRYKEFVAKRLFPGKEVRLQVHKEGSFKRYVTDVYYKPYPPEVGVKERWLNEELREKLARDQDNG